MKKVPKWLRCVLWIVLAGVFICIALGISFMTNSGENSIGSWFQKKTQGMALVEAQDTDGTDDGEGSKEEVILGPEKLLPEGEVIQINAFSVPGDYHYSFSDSETINALKDYFDTLELTSDFPEKPEDYLGMSWVLEFMYSDQRTETICHFGNTFVRNSNGKWYKMKYEQAAKLEELLGFEFPVTE